MLALRPVCALIGSTLFALLLSGSQRIAAIPNYSADRPAAREMARLFAEGARLYGAANYSRAHDIFLQAAEVAGRAGDQGKAAFDWNNAGVSSIGAKQFGKALKELRQAQQIAQAARQPRPLLFALNSLATLYIQMGQYENAIAIAREALDGPAGHADEAARARVLCDAARALCLVRRFSEATPYFSEGLNKLLDLGDLEAAVRGLGNFGNDNLSGGSAELAEWALSEALYLVRVHRITPSTNVLLGLARLRGRQEKPREAARFFEAALAEPPGLTSRWRIYKERGRLRLDQGDLTGALADYREARRLAARLRVDMVPADQDRVQFESGLSDVMQGLVGAGNRLAREKGARAILGETFDAAEQDRLWSLRALVPTPNDWRARLPENYWEVLTRYQTLQRTASASGSVASDQSIAQLGTQLQLIEASAAGDSGRRDDTGESPLRHAISVLDDDSVLFSFHLSGTSCWVWAVDRRGVDVYPLPPMTEMEARITAFGRAVREGAPSTDLALHLYKDLFGLVGRRYLRHANWRLELDGPLYNLPFAALVTQADSKGTAYLIQNAVLETVPGALLLKRDAMPATGEFLAIGDPVYNTADPRYRGKKAGVELMLPRLPGSAAEVDECARAWNSGKPVVLTGTDARPAAIDSAMRRNPAIVHFATHVIAGPGDFGSGLIALSLNSSGAMELLGPKDIVARRTNARLIVMNGCHSAQGDTLPGAGLMGLTRAWIGAGASAVLSTQWDIPDTSQDLMPSFYRHLRASADRGAAFALNAAQLEALKDHQPLSNWAAYSLLSRIP